ncbi:hypothetical protein GCM10027051_14520 [Niabella terrae]
MKLPLKWEFPGGKIEAGESKEECLIREIKEELGVQIRIISALPVVHHKYPESEIRLYPFICAIETGSLHAREHIQFKWVEGKALLNFDLAAADLPIVLEIQEI